MKKLTDKFAVYKEKALSTGIKHCESGPLVRSSYKAKESYENLNKRTTDLSDCTDNILKSAVSA